MMRPAREASVLRASTGYHSPPPPDLCSIAKRLGAARHASVWWVFFFLYCLLNYSYMQQHRTHNPQRVATPHLTVKVSHNNDRRGCWQKWQNAQYSRVVSHIILSSWRANGVEYYNAIRNKLYRTDYNVGIIMLCKL